MIQKLMCSVFCDASRLSDKNNSWAKRRNSQILGGQQLVVSGTETCSEGRHQQPRHLFRRRHGVNQPKATFRQLVPEANEFDNVVYLT